MSLKIERIKISSPDLEKAIGLVLDLQKSLLLDHDSTNLENGFIINAFYRDELMDILKKYNGVLFCGYEADQLVGYSLVVEMEAFSNILKHPGGALFEPKTNLQWSEARYLYQIAVRRDLEKHGYGSKLLNRCKSEHPQGLLADVYVEPLRNFASIVFFEKNGFKAFGTLTLKNYQGFDELNSKVFLWKP